MTQDDASEHILSSLFTSKALLPIAKYERDLCYAVETHQVTILIGQTGSGKTTQLPQFLARAGWCADGRVVGVTQPRRVAATSVATRVADEMRCNVGQEVGYSIRFEDVTSAKTQIKFLTDGMLLREALVDPLLQRYSVIMVDEAHERSLSSDILLALLKKIRKKRSDLHIVVSSATLQAKEFLDFFARGHEEKNSETSRTIFFLAGRMYPVDIHYLQSPTEDYIERTLQTVFEIHRDEPPGDILVFLTGRDEIERVVAEISSRSDDLPPGVDQLRPLPLFAGLPVDEQMSVFDRAPATIRKVIVATNIAEASVTIDGIVYVIDCGFVKVRAYNPATGMESLTVTPTSKSSATQRAGRAGRTRAGKCYRLYPKSSFDVMDEATVPEIQRSNLAPLILQLKALGIDNIARFDFLTAPPAELLTRGLELLYSLGALDDYARLTKPLGLRMAEIAIEPMMAKVLLSSPQFGCLEEILSIAAMASLQGSVWISHDGGKKAQQASRHKFAAEEGDHVTLLNVFDAFVAKGKKGSQWCRDNYLNFQNLTSAVSIRNQLRNHLARFGVAVDGHSTVKVVTDLQEKSIAERICRCLTAGYFAHAARMQPDGTFKTVNGGTTLYAHPSSLMFNRKADWVIFHEVMETGAKAYIRDVTKIDKAWLMEYAPDFYQIRR